MIDYCASLYYSIATAFLYFYLHRKSPNKLLSTIHVKAAYLRTYYEKNMQIYTSVHTPSRNMPKVAFPHSPAFTVLGRDTRANPLAYMRDLIVFPYHILTIENTIVNAKMRTIYFRQLALFGFKSNLFKFLTQHRFKLYFLT